MQNDVLAGHVRIKGPDIQWCDSYAASSASKLVLDAGISLK